MPASTTPSTRTWTATRKRNSGIAGGGMERCMLPKMLPKMSQKTVQTTLQTVRLSVGDDRYAAAIRDAAARSCAWHVELVERPDPSLNGVLVLDEASFERLVLPLPN